MDYCFFDSNDVLPLHGNINSMSRTENVISGYKYAYTRVPNLQHTKKQMIQNSILTTRKKYGKHVQEITPEHLPIWSHIF